MVAALQALVIELSNQSRGLQWAIMILGILHFHEIQLPARILTPIKAIGANERPPYKPFLKEFNILRGKTSRTGIASTIELVYLLFYKYCVRNVLHNNEPKETINSSGTEAKK